MENAQLARSAESGPAGCALVPMTTASDYPRWGPVWPGSHARGRRPSGAARTC